MRTTLDIDDDILALARGIVSNSKGKKSLGTVVSEFARQGVVRGAVHQALGAPPESELDRQLSALGVVPYQHPPHHPAVTDELVRELRDSEGL